MREDLGRIVKAKLSEYPVESKPEKFLWSENPSVQRLLDVVVGIIAEEYVQTARRTPETFREIASGPPAPRNDVGVV